LVLQQQQQQLQERKCRSSGNMALVATTRTWCRTAAVAVTACCSCGWRYSCSHNLGLLASDGALAQRTICMSQKPQVDARAVEGVRTSRQPPYLVPRLQFADANGALRRILSQLNLSLSGDCLAWQGADLRGSKACINRAWQSLVASQTTHMPPTGDNILILDFTQVRLSTAHAALENPGNSTQGTMEEDPQVAERQPESRKPQLCS